MKNDEVNTVYFSFPLTHEFDPNECPGCGNSPAPALREGICPACREMAESESEMLLRSDEDLDENGEWITR